MFKRTIVSAPKNFIPHLSCNRFKKTDTLKKIPVASDHGNEPGPEKSESADVGSQSYPRDSVGYREYSLRISAIFGFVVGIFFVTICQITSWSTAK